MEPPASPTPPATVRRNPPRQARQTPAAKSLIPAMRHLQDLDPPPPAAASENLKVFLRIRPLQVSPPITGRKPSKFDAAAIGKGGLPKAESRKNSTCLTANGPSSVTLLAPTSMFDNKRVKNEVYDGFSFVFPPDSSQQEVYDRAINPILMDFMGKKSTLLVSMGPTGSGKTYTMFGSAREPGIVPLTLKQIFNYPSEGNDGNMRSYYMSMLEIYSERGKGEKILDLSANGTELSFQNSNIIGLKELMISNIEEAESLLALGLLKRSTASTGANDQSSRSQCIINIRSIEKDPNGCNSSHTTVLTIADLAGAEREKKTGNQGARLQESNFINNTSMVFGLCLRSLLEHQKNPKRPLEKHFKNSLLTRYLRDYMEGKKRMTLILTVKPGEDDYADTSFLLRQASPYMKIKFTSPQEHLNLPHKKRTTSLLSSHHKRRKVNVSETPLDDDGSHSGDRSNGFIASDKGADPKKIPEVVISDSSIISTEVVVPVMGDTARNNAYQMELQSLARKEEIMGKFSKALWTVLKEYKQKLIESENNAQSLREALREEQIRVMELNKQVEKLKSHCSLEVDAPHGYCRTCVTRLATPSHQVCSNSTFHNKSASVSPVGSPAKEVKPGVRFCGFVEDELDKNSIGISQTMLPLVEETLVLEEKKISALQSSELISVDQHFEGQNCQVIDLMPENMPVMAVAREESVGPADCEPTKTSTNLDRSDNGNENPSSFISLTAVDAVAASSSIVEETTDLKENRRMPEPEPLQYAKSSEKYCASRALKEKNATVDESSNVSKPKRRKLLPASAMLLKDLSSLDLETANRETKGKLTQGGGPGLQQNNPSLLSLLRKQT